MNKCKNCNSEFKEWEFSYQCQNCDDGITESVRDIDFDGTGYCRCSVCSGTGEVTRKEFSFCCEECMDEYEQTNIN